MLIKNVNTLSIGEIVRSQHPFFVPVYQRGYAWETEEIDDYVTDIRTLVANRPLPNVPAPQHFFGGTVSVHHHAQNRVGRKHEVVDGQQRLATFTLTIATIVHALDELARSAADPQAQAAAQAYATQLRDDYIHFSEVQNGQPVVLQKLTLSSADEPFFGQLVAGANPAIAPARESHERIKAAYETIRRDLVQPRVDQPGTDQEKVKRLVELADIIASECVVIHIVSDNRMAAYRLFSILNDRGRSLSDGDLLRATTLELLDPAQHRPLQARAEQHWDRILMHSEEEIDRFLRTYYPSVTGDRAPRRDLFDTYRSRFFSYPAPLSVNDATAIAARVSEMEAEQVLVRRLQQGDWPFQPAAASGWKRDRLWRLVVVLGHALSIPLLLSAVKLGETRFAELVILLERFAFRYLTISKAHPTPLYGIYYAEALSIRQNPGAFTLARLQTALRGRIQRSADDATFSAGLANRLHYSNASADKRNVKYFLSTMESYAAWLARGGNGAPQADETQVLDLDELTIEHVYPRNPAAPDAALEARKDDLGNLALWGPRDNRAAANDLFPQKKAKYAASNLLLTRELGSYPDWTLQRLDDRQSELIREALKVFVV